MRLKPQQFLVAMALVVSFSASAKGRKAVIYTPYGKVVVQLSTLTPLHTNNFIRLVRHHYFDGILFHRVIRRFMIQGGDPDSRNAVAGGALGEGGPKERIPAEFRPELFHRRGALAAARDNNPEKASSASQFYIVQGKVFTEAGLDSVETMRLHRKIPADERAVYKTEGGAPHLDQNYTVFGQVISGMNAVDSIAAQPVDPRNRPLKDIPMKIRMKKRFLFF